MSGPLEPGDSKTGVALFGSVSEEATIYNFVVLGLNNTYRVDGKKFDVYRRILSISYERPGDEFEVTQDKMVFLDSNWSEEKVGEK